MTTQKWNLVPVDCWRELEPYLGKDVPNREVVLLSDVKGALAALLQEMVNTSEAEPVLVVETEPGYWNRGHYYEGTKSYIDPTKVWGLPVGTKLYTAPQPTRLSDDRILSIGKRFLDRGYYPFEGLQPWVYSFARAIEREILGE